MKGRVRNASMQRLWHLLWLLGFWAFGLLGFWAFGLLDESGGFVEQSTTIPRK